jgi:uncharacterized protein (DUF305 family)
MIHRTYSRPWSRRFTVAALAMGTLWLAVPHAGQAQAAPVTGNTPRGLPADVAFMQGMMAHHAQALTMSALVSTHTTRREMRVLAERIDVSQKDEIEVMRRWLAERNQPVPMVGPGHDAHASHDMPGMASMSHTMPGMLSPAQMDSLAAARGVAFDRLFLRYMIQHHEGALTMVAALLKTPGAAVEPMLYQFVSDVDTDQRAEIRRMKALLEKWS